MIERTPATIVLLIEDNPGDQKLVSLALADSTRIKALHVVDDGEKALAFLHRTGSYSQAPRPDLVLLDLNLPGKNGFEVLGEMRADEALRVVPVIVLSSSGAARDVHRAHAMGANAFLTKPIELDDFFEMVRGIERFWMRLSTLPARERS